MGNLLRLLRILHVGLRFRLYRFMPRFADGEDPTRAGKDSTRAVRLREALEALGPIFVKFGQVLSTRRDLLPADLADELAQLQDNVPPFPAAQARALVEKAFGRPIDSIFESFDAEPVASASIAQVHFACLLYTSDAADE